METETAVETQVAPWESLSGRFLVVERGQVSRGGDAFMSVSAVFCCASSRRLGRAAFWGLSAFS